MLNTCVCNSFWVGILQVKCCYDFAMTYCNVYSSGILQCDIAFQCLLTFWILCLQGAVGLASMIIVRFAFFDLNAYLSALELHLWEARANTLVVATVLE